MAAADVMILDESDYEDDFLDEDSDFDVENVAPVSNKKSKAATTSKKASGGAKKGKAAKKTLSSILSPNKNAENVTSKSSSKKTIEQIYQKKTQLEHILLRPDTYIGSVERITKPMFVLDSDAGRIVQRETTFTPGLYKIFDEIVVNAADNKQRDTSMDKMDITVEPETNTISVKNNGKGIPVVMHKEHDCYVPTLIFGHLLTGSNFDDGEKKTTGGRNGYGAKLANIFSSKFVVECVDSNAGLKFHQVFRDNMSVKEEPTVKKCTATEKKQGDYTKITFSPDLQRFKMTSLDSDSVGLLSKRAYDIAGSMANRSGKKLAVTLNGKKLPVKTFKDYLALYDGVNPPDAYEKIGNRWEVGVSASCDDQFQQVSFVNAISTSKGGSHVAYITDQVAAHLVKTIKKKNKGGAEVKPAVIKNHLCIFVNCLIENPAFDSQTKEFLTTQKKVFGSDCKLTDKFLKQVDKSGVVEKILQYAQFKQKQALKRQGGVKKSKLTGIAKLDDANKAGTAKSKDCTLIITEGDSAKSLAMSGLSVVGRDFYGVFPLKGKPLNVREASHKQIVGNEEIKNVVDIMGLKFGMEYDETNIKSLRYGHLMIMADQDHDGSHIKGLVINFIHHFWPSLLNVPGFLQQFITPIVKATKGKKTHTFFTLPEYDAWKESTGNDGKGFTIKYYKGLGTSTSAEAKEYFSSLDTHEIHFSSLSSDIRDIQDIQNDDDSNMDVDTDRVVPDKPISGADLIEMAFKKDRVEDRKTWLNNMEKDTFLNYSEAHGKGVKFSDFINKELILFSQADNQRSIPHVMDGFKPSQRKVLYSCFKRKLKGEIKVAQLAGYVGEHSAYHHGEMSLTGTIVGMAQSYVGSNNVNLLTPSGQFGTRRMGGKDSASARYIFTKLEKITRAIYHPDDDALLNYLKDDGLSIEPEFYMPVIPMVLVNGSDGIGTGWSSNVPNFDPRAIIRGLRSIIAGEQPEKLVPHYCGFTGEMIALTGKKEGSYSVHGRIERTNETTLLITELPIKKWTQDYKQFLEVMLNGDDKKKTEAEIKDFQENHTDTTVSFTITATKEKIDMFEKEKDGLPGKFKLNGSINTSNMTLFDEEGHIIRYNSPEDILHTFYNMRLDYYVRRKELLLEKLRKEQLTLSNKARFVEEVCSGDLIVSNRKRTDILHDLQARNYDLMDAKQKASDDEDDEDDSIEETASDAELAKGYEYLLGMKIWSLTFEKAEQLRAQLAEKTNEVGILEATEPSQIWLNDLEAIEEALDERDDEMEAAANDELKAQNKSKKARQKKAKAATKRTTKKKKINEWDSDMEESSDSDFEAVQKKAAPARKRTTAPKATTKKAATKVQTKLKEQLVAGMPKQEDVSVLVSATTTTTSSDIHSASSIQELDSSSDEEDVTVSLLDRMKKKLVVSPPAKSRGTKRPSPRSPAPSQLAFNDSDSPGPLDDFDTAQFEPASVTPARKKAVSKKKAPAKKLPAKKPAAKKPKATTTTKQVRRKKQAVIDIDDSEDDFDFKESDDEDISAPAQPRARAGRARARTAVDYAQMIDSDSDDSDFE